MKTTSLSKAVGTLRERAGMTQEDLAKLLKVKRPQISRYERKGDGMRAEHKQALLPLLKKYDIELISVDPINKLDENLLKDFHELDRNQKLDIIKIVHDLNVENHNTRFRENVEALRGE